jgi:uncharacterized protein YoxC
MEVSNQKKTYKLDKDLIFKLASIMCTYEEIAEVVGTSVSTLQKRYKHLIEKRQANGKKSIRRAQFEAAVEKKDVRMLMFLGKNYLGQQDQPVDTENTAPLPWEKDI